MMTAERCQFEIPDTAINHLRNKRRSPNLSEMASDVSDVCQQLQRIQLQLSLVLNRNEEVLDNLGEVEKLVNEGPSLDKDVLRKNIHRSKTVSKKLEECVQTQCTALSKAVTELEQRSADAQNPDESSILTEKSSLEFQLKAQLNHNVHLHQENAELETRLKEHMETLKESGRQADRLEEELVETKKQVKDLLDLFENKAIAAEKRILELQEAMESSQKRAQQYQNMYEAEKETSLQLEKENTERMKGVEEGEEEREEEDGIGPVLISRPQTSVSRVKSAPITPQHIDPLYQSVIEENKSLRSELERLREDNTHLMKKSKQAQRDIETIQNHVATCSGQREDLRRRLKREQDDHRRLQSSLTRQASDWVTQKKMGKDIDHHSKVGRVQTESTLTASTRYRSHPIKPTDDKPRNIAVENWSSGN